MSVVLKDAVCYKDRIAEAFSSSSVVAMCGDWNLPCGDDTKSVWSEGQLIQRKTFLPCWTNVSVVS